MMKRLMVFGACAVLLSGCGEEKKKEEAKPKEEKTPAAALISNSELVRQAVESLKPVTVKEFTLEQRILPEFEAASQAMDTLAQLEAMTGIKFYGESRQLEALSPRAKAVLTAKNPKYVPFFTEDLTSGVTYFAPADAQEKIIANWKSWFAACGKTLDAPAPSSSPKTTGADPAVGLMF